MERICLYCKETKDETEFCKPAGRSKKLFFCKICMRIIASRGGKKNIPNLLKRNATSAFRKIALRGALKGASMTLGENNYGWKGGISRLPYGFDFDEKLKALIRERDQHKCQLCGAPQEEFTKKLPVHHIDYDKKNNDPKNLITLCNSCNAKVNSKREYWIEYFQSPAPSRIKRR